MDTKVGTLGSMLSAPLIGSAIASQWGTLMAFAAAGDIVLVGRGVVTLVLRGRT